MGSDQNVKGKISLPSGSFSKPALDALVDISEGRNNKVPEEEPPHINELREENLIRGRTRWLRSPVYTIDDKDKSAKILSEYERYINAKMGGYTPQ